MKRKFLFGDEWIYIKIYGNLTVLDRLLTTDLYDLVKEYYEVKIIYNFFFVRYNDKNGYHLRLRFQVEQNRISNFIVLLNTKLTNHLNNRLISNVSTEVYTREVERYGIENITHVESIFGYNSILIIHALKTLKEKEKEDDRWVFGCKIIDDLLNSFQMTTNQKHLLFEEYFKYYEKEFSVDSTLRNKISIKYKKLNDVVFKELNKDPIEYKLFSLKDKNQIAIDKILQNFSSIDRKIDLVNLLKNITHMHFNRIFISKSRENELVIYYFLSKIYKTLDILTPKDSKKTNITSSNLP
ncbi:thiopeptide-type bacteriocin biosynthesis protein [Pedobacter jeongneungensis]|uniref:thiopeptide-type bacteriocin biosynthesis protein n=1 Tax=Pedobacter jeongneungensis TaxID=947309 RepID=UPI000468463B|nr:thiopeptide-type bacteriocin biosynthesis protein [Pedobacter jeongneungensis]